MVILKRTTIVLIITVLIAVAVGLVYNRTVTSHENVSKLVMRALSRDENTNYVAHVVTTAQYNARNIKTNAIIYHQGSMEKLEYPGSRIRKVWSMLRDGKSYTYLPKENRILVSETSRMLSDADRSKLMTRNYRIVNDGMDQVAGRSTYVVDISSRFDGRPSKKLWIDKQYLTVLKSIDYSAAGDEHGSMEIKRIQYNVRINPSTFTIPSDGSVKMVMVCKSAKSTSLFKTLGFRVLAPKYIPTGYKVEGYHIFNSQCNCNHQSAQITYTDGLNLISVFQTPNMTCCKDGTCNMANCGKDKGCAVADCSVAKTGQMSRKDRTVVVVGDLLPEDVKKITESVR